MMFWVVRFFFLLFCEKSVFISHSFFPVQIFYNFLNKDHFNLQLVTNPITADRISTKRNESLLRGLSMGWVLAKEGNDYIGSCFLLLGIFSVLRVLYPETVSSGMHKWGCVLVSASKRHITIVPP